MRTSLLKNIFFILFWSILYANDLDTTENLYSCLENNAQSCEILIDSGLPSVDECNIKACILIARIYEIAKNYEMSNMYYNKACKSDVMESCFDIALNYESLKEYKKALSMYEYACDRGFMPSCYNLGVLFLNGLGVKEDVKRANALFLEACSNGEAQGCFNVGISYRNGIGFKADRKKAMEFFSKACKMDIIEACRELEILKAADFEIYK